MHCFVSLPLLPTSRRRHRTPLCALDSPSGGSDSSGGTSSDDGTGRSSEFYGRARSPPQGVDWEHWRATPGSTAALPLLPFPAHHIMLPGEEKTLHLFESRYLALFDAALLRFDKTFGHILLSEERAALAASGTLVTVSEWERADIGVKLRIQGIGRIQVQEVEVGAAFIVGSVRFVEDGDGGGMEALLDLEERFWKAALRLIDLAVELGVAPFRSKEEVAVPTFDETDAFGVTSTPPPAMHLDAEKKKVVYMQQLRTAVKRGELPLSISGSDSKVELADEEKTMSRLTSVSFVGFDLFDNHIGQRQKALETKSCAERMLTVITGTDERIKHMEAQLALQRAFPS